MQTVVAHTQQCIEAVPINQKAVNESNKQKLETKHSSAISLDTRITQSFTTSKITVLVAEVHSKIRNSFNTMPYSDITCVVSNSPPECLPNK